MRTAQTDIQETLAEAATLVGLRAGEGELAEAAGALRAHIEAMLPAAEEHAATLWRGSPEWYRLRSTLDSIQREIASAPPPTALSGHVRVELLRRSCAWLLEHHGPGGAREGS
ncbi:DUF6415 family natural product biosynthesis protein [Streptomyces corynorhini]|uniref:Uncharacterized protein n=1 Tax=Streptomyces corynorhini TaxID=2282652 RepID=A0A370B852_9ACTN|nr:DUF6415 family natural product biosynthesis protein [Streptomyces corynorhini]RDG37980.1 hypothetical protein DVH02_11700 [Streptomyces corynorhini]